MGYWRVGIIKVVDQNIVGDEVKFKYYMGINKRRKFKVILDRELVYNQWYEFIDASEENFDIYHTDLPESTTNQMAIGNVQRKKCKIDYIDEEALIFIRGISPTVIEYVVATEEGVKKEEYLGEIKKIELN